MSIKQVVAAASSRVEAAPITKAQKETLKLLLAWIEEKFPGFPLEKPVNNKHSFKVAGKPVVNESIQLKIKGRFSHLSLIRC